MTIKETYLVSKSGISYTKDLSTNQTYHSMKCVEYNEGVRDIVVKEEFHLEARILILTTKREALVDGAWAGCNFPNGKVERVTRATDEVYVDETTGDVVDSETALDEDGLLVTGYVTDVDYHINLLASAHHNLHEQVINKNNGI